MQYGQGAAAPPRIPALDGIRACAFLTVFASHAVSERIFPGGLGVTVFFFLSGYLITTLLRQEAARTGGISLRNFYIRRARRILAPMYITVALGYAALALGLIATRTTAQAGLATLLYYYNYYALLTGNNLPGGTGVVWSLMIEEHFYFVFPLLYLGFLRFAWSGRRQAVFLLILCALVLLWRCLLVFGLHTPLDPVHSWTYRATDARCDAILWGCVLAVRGNPVFNTAEKFSRALALAGAAVILASLLVRDPGFRETLRYTLQSAALLPVFQYLVANRAALLTRWLDGRALRFIGDHSYAMYLGHGLALTLVAALPVGKALVAVAGFGLTLGYAVAMRVLVEAPLRKGKNVLF